MSTRETQPTISDVRLERYRLGELPEAERQALAARLAGDPALRDRLSQLQRSDEEIAASYPAHQVVHAIRRRAAPPSRAWLVPLSITATCVCVAAVALSAWLVRPRGDDTTIKGGSDASLVLYRKLAAGSETLKRGAVVRQGDEIRVGYRASGRAYGAILSIDGRGNLTQHLPATGEQAAGLQPSGTVLLDFAYELDDAPRWEAFYFVAADAPFALEPVRRAIRDAAARTAGSPAALALPGAFAQFLFPLTKDHR